MRPSRSLLPMVSVLILALQFLPTQKLPATQAAQPMWGELHILGNARLAPIERLQRDFAFLAEGVDTSSTTTVNELFSALSDGIDARQPVGAALLFDDDFVPVIFVPVKDEQKLFDVLGARFGLMFEKEADGLYRWADPNSEIDLAARVVGHWLYVTGFSKREVLRDVPPDPTNLFEGSDPTLTAHVTLRIDQLPEAIQGQLLRVLTNANPATVDEAPENAGSQFARKLIVELLPQTKSIQFELQCFRPLEQFHVTSRFVAVEGSDLERWIDGGASHASQFSHLPSNDAVFAMISSLKLDAEAIRPLLEAWEPLAAKAQAAAPSPRSRNEAESLLGRLVTQAVESVTKTLAKGELDAGFAVERQGRDQVVLLAGTTLQGARALEETATEVGTLLQQSAEFRALEWSVGGNADVSIHQLTVPVTDESTLKLFGNPAYLAIGVGTEKLYAAIGGEETLTRLAEAVDRAREEASERGELFRVSARLAPLLAALDSVPGENSESDREIHEYAELIAPFKKNDVLELSIKAEEHALEARMRVDMGVVRMLAAKVPVGPELSPPTDLTEVAGTLRLRAGEDFQLTFRSESEVTTTIDGQDRIDRSTNSLTYDFRVVKVNADGTMQIATALSHASFDKITPEGREAYDSSNPPEADRLTAETMLYGLVIGEPFYLSVRPDGTIAAISGLAEAIERVLDTKAQPPASERERVHAYIAQLLNEASLRDSLTRGFEFYPGHKVSAGDRWSRTSENLTVMNFLLDSRYQAKTLSGDGVTISIRSQVREPNPADVANQPIQWEFVGSQTGMITIDPHSGRLRRGEFTLRLDAEATFEMDGNMVSRPIVNVTKVTVGDPQQVAQKVAGEAVGGSSSSADWVELAGDMSRSRWRASQQDAWLIDGGEIISRGGNYERWSYVEYTDRSFADFEITADVLYAPECNGGICLRATSGGLDGVNPSGYEIQLLGVDTDRNPTGSIYKMSPNGPVSGVYSARPRLVQPNEWFSIRVVAQGPQLTVYINGERVAAYDDQSEPIRSGHVILQGSPEGMIRYKDVRIRPL